MSPNEAYKSLIASGEFQSDPAQALAVEEFDRMHHALINSAPREAGLLSKLFRSRQPVAPVTGLYLWGGVGRGKTWMMDTFFGGLPFEKKRRVHFHRYMQGVHESLKELRGQQNPLELLGDQQASEFRVLCFDEFVVEDIGDAMILSGLLQALFERGVTLVATSNTAPDDLYRDGLQRARFKPAIELIKQHTHVMHMADGDDYRLRALDTDAIYHVPADAEAEAKLKRSFTALTGATDAETQTISILGRDIECRARVDGVIWFDFENICGGPRSSHDYIEIAQEFHTVIVSEIPEFDNTRNDEARRFIEMIDEFYDRNINLIVSAQADPTALYQGVRLVKPFERTSSRLIEMQSRDYLSREKKT